MPDEKKKLTDADVMTGYNPSRDLSAEDAETQQDDVETVEGAAPEGTTEVPTEVEVNLDGRRLKAPREIAEAFTREINRRDGTRGAELQTLRERLARLEGAATTATRTAEGEKPPEGPQVPDPELQIENPAEYQRQLLAFVSHSQETRTQILANAFEAAETAKEQETTRRAAWAAHCDEFYTRPENKSLVGNKDIVDLVLEQHKAALAPLSVEDGFVELGRLARDRIAQLTGVAPDLKARRTPKPPVLEGSSRRESAVTPPTPGGEGPSSLTQVLKDRRKAAAAGFGKGGSGAPIHR